MELISVIIPVYNVEKYISKCIKSIMKQTYTKLEIILVNDGSSDNSSQLCEKFAKYDERIKVIHKKNSGVSAARNTGILASIGAYLCFVDSDDFLPKSAIENLYNGIKTSNGDLCCGCWAKITAKGTAYNSHKKRIITTDDKPAMMEIMNYEEIKGPVAKLFKTEIITNNNISFLHNIRINEDTIFCYQYLQYCEKVCIIDENVYYYNRLSVGSATTCYYEKFNWSSWLCIVEYFKNIIDCENNWYDYSVQRKIVDQYLSVNKYILFYLYDSPKQAIEKLEETYKLFQNSIKMDTIYDSPDIFQEFIETYQFLFEEDFGGLFDYLYNKTNKNKRTEKNLKNFIIEVISKIKTFVIFKLKLGYND